jgi:DNA-binding HxlR family transcriptional regulator
MASGSYNQFCPVAMAAEILCTRWTVVLLRELVAGSTRFNDLRRGVPRMSPALLSKRLKDLEAAGVVERSKVVGEADTFEYRLTKSGRDLAPVIEAVGIWGQRWIETESSLDNLDPNLLMWDMRRNINPQPMPKHRNVIQVIFSDLQVSQKNWWLIVQSGEDVDLCSVDPGFDVDLYLSTDLRTMTEVWMGYTTLTQAKAKGTLTITGNRQLEANMKTWLSLSPFAKFEKRVA